MEPTIPLFLNREYLNIDYLQQQLAQRAPSPGAELRRDGEGKFRRHTELSDGNITNASDSRVVR